MASLGVLPLPMAYDLYQIVVTRASPVSAFLCHPAKDHKPDADNNCHKYAERSSILNAPVRKPMNAIRFFSK